LKKVLVTGGAGFIGSNFVNKSLRDRPDLEITVLDALTYAGKLSNLEPVEDQITFIQGDIRDANLVSQVVAGQDLIVHFAAESHNDNSLKNPSFYKHQQNLKLINH
jgi:dTDP-glucose 4,6-dehydratase